MTVQLCTMCRQPLRLPRNLCARCGHSITSHEINRGGKRTWCARISPYGRCSCQEFTQPNRQTATGPSRLTP